MKALRLLLASMLPGLVGACAAGSSPSNEGPAPSGGAGGTGGAGGSISTTGGSGGAGGASINPTGGSGGMESCTGVTQEAELDVLPVDIIWVVDNSNSMEPSVLQVKQGLNDFAALISASNLDYKVIVLSKRGTAPLELCIPEPLAGNATCGNGARFFHADIEILSTQPLEQLLGSLGQTDGYAEGDAKGGEPWAAELRPEATKTIVVVTDDNSRLSATDFQTFPGGKNPFNSLTLPPGLLDPSWNGLFDGYAFSGIYGWGNDQDPTVTCTYPDQSAPPSAGPTYTTLVSMTGGVRAKICEGAGAWAPFFGSVAQAVTTNAQVACTLAIPAPPSGEELDFDAVNVKLVSGAVETTIPNVGTAAACGADEGWYYDDIDAPTAVVLCPASCEHAQELAGPGKAGAVEVLFGCATIVK